MSEHTITELLSPAFLSRMQNMLGDEYESFLKSYEAPRTYGLRVNTAKISCDEFERIVPFPVTPIPWISNGYFYPEDVRPSFCPLYQAGLFYLQEPSAMTPASCLPVTPGENVLDLCAEFTIVFCIYGIFRYNESNFKSSCLHGFSSR